MMLSLHILNLKRILVIAALIAAAPASNVRIYNVKLNSYNVTFDAVNNATEYVVRTYLDQALVSEVTSTSTDIQIFGVYPSDNEYWVSVAHRMSELSNFSQNVPTKIWNFTSVTETSLTFTWSPHSPVTVYVVRVVNNNTLAEKSDSEAGTFSQNTKIESLTLNGLAGGVTCKITVQVDYFTDANKTTTPLFEVTQITLSPVPTNLAIAEQIENNVTLTWDASTGAASYDVALLDRGSTNRADGVQGVGSVTNNQTTFTNLTNGATYTFQVCPRNRAGLGACSTINVTGNLSSTGSLATDDVTQTSMRVTFDAVPGATSYNLTVTTTAETFYKSSNTNSLQLTGLQAGTVHNLSVTVIYSTEASDTSPTHSSITIPPNIATSSLSLITGNSSALTLRWEVGRGTDSTVLDLFFNNGTEIKQNVVNPTTLENLFNKLEPGTEYVVSIRARNKAGDSDRVNVTVYTAPAPPANLTLEPGSVTETTLNVSFEASTGAVSYTIGYSDFNSNINMTSHQFTALTAGTSYAISVQAISPQFLNTELVSDPSNVLSITTAPGVIQNFKVTARTSSSLDISFDDVTGADQYQVVAFDENGITDFSGKFTSNTGTVNGLKDGTTYTINVTAENQFASGQVLMSNAGLTRSVSPTPIIFTAINQTSFTVSWTDQRPFGTLLYLPTISSPAGVSRVSGVPAATRDFSFTATMLRPGTEYTISLLSFDSMGDAPQATTNTTVSLPNIPSMITVVNQTSSSVDLNWTDVQSATNYRLNISNIDSDIITTKFTAASMYSVDGLSPGTEYNVSIEAENRNGFGFAESTLAYTIHDPFQSTITFVDNTNSSITISVSSTPGVESYIVTAMSATNTQNCTAMSSSPSCTIMSLDAGVDHDISAAGVYVSGSKSGSGSPNSLTTKPAAPSITGQTSGNFITNIIWSSVVGATSYNVDNAGDLRTVSETSISISGLDSGTAYSFTVSATKRTSYGNFTGSSTTVSIETSRAVPTNLTVSNVQSASFDVSWNSIPGAINYTVEAAPQANGSIITGTSTATKLALSNLTPGQTHDVTVTATFPTGTGSSSAPVSQITAPSKPTNLRVASVTSSNVTLEWDSVPSATSYDLMYSSMSSPFTTMNATNNNETVSGLMSGTIYYFKVVAVNGMLKSSESNVTAQITNPDPVNFLLNATVTTQTTIMTAWSAPVAADDYLVRVWELANNVTTADRDMQFTYTDGIRPGQNYTLCVRARTSNSNGGPQESSEKCTRLVTISGNTTLPLEIASTADSLSFMWKSSAGATHYEVVIAFANDSLVMSKNVTSPTTNHTFNDLPSGTFYLVSVTPFSSAGRSFTFGPTRIQTNPESPIVAATSITTTEIGISWTLPRGTFLTLITVKLNEGNPVNRNVTIPLNGTFYPSDGTTAIVTGLTDATDYIFIITTFAEEKKSDPVSVARSTLTMPPNSINIDSNSVDGFTLSFDPPTGAVNFTYDVVGSNGDTFTQTSQSARVNFTDIVVGSVYNITIIAWNKDGLASDSSSITLTAAAQRVFSLQATLNSSEFGQFNPALIDKTSSAFTNLSNRLLPILESTFNSSSGFVSVVIERFSQGSIIVWFGVVTTSYDATHLGMITIFEENASNDMLFSNVDAHIDCSTNPCAINANCTDVSSENYTCECKNGYTGDGFSCFDVNECNVSSTCHSNATCQNTEGSFECSCNAGYEGNGATCVDIDECSDGSNNCDSNANCSNTESSFTCTCTSGYTGDGIACTKMKSCSIDDDTCGDRSTCTNVSGSYTCSCDNGYSDNGTNCNDVDECLGNPCASSGKCDNSDGSFTCSCNTGFNGDGFTCSDVNECLSSPCTNANCSNSMGSFTCECHVGFTGSGIVCTDIDECSDNPCHTDAVCENTKGSFTCTCSQQFVGDGFDCERSSCNNCGTNAVCDSSADPAICSCKAGYVGDGKTCIDINECSSDPCHTNATCTNTDGSYACACNASYLGDGITCSLFVRIQLTLASYVFSPLLQDNTSSEYQTLADTVRNDLPSKFPGVQINITRVTFVEGSVIAVIELLVLDVNSESEFVDRFDANQGRATLFASGPSYGPCVQNTPPCGNNAVCESVSSGISCTCNQGYSGTPPSVRCTDIDECANANAIACGGVNGTCTNTIGSYSCACAQGYTNSSGVCVGQCTIGFCLNGATCAETPGNGNPACRCASDFTGDRCDQQNFTRILAIVFGVIGGVILIILIGLIFLCVTRKNRGGIAKVSDRLPP